MNNKYLFHHGIKGQRWGIRRFQNEDGTLTPLGKKRYGNPNEPDDSVSNREALKLLVRDYRRADSEAAKAILEGTSKSLYDSSNIVGNIGKNKSKTINKSDYSKISDDELRRRINRLTMERTYGELVGDTKRVRSGADWTREVLQTTGAIVGIGATAAGIAYTINNIKLEKNKGG